ncbi:ROK family protein [Oribacterium sp. WCC10]|uniref:ROK family protein n=1 Tax=Oribacterium sp. WCC10 TaxID=1855343 RepID=UPI0008E1EA8B|nr:ROK family protein [Oribacterium sp. WCC10]SFG16379.1 glucokinase [Oribacterium sp. WCC10]
MENRYLGIDIGGTTVKFGLVTEEGIILEKAGFSVDFDSYETPVLETVLKHAKEFCKEPVTAIGVSATGQIDSIEGRVIGAAGHIPNYIGSEIKKELEKYFHVPVYVANDANCALLGEQWLGAAKGCKDVVMVTLGTGVGGGILTGGHLLTGNRGLGGEIGHIIINVDGNLCTCGNRGCLEEYASTKALVSSIRDMVTKGVISKEFFGVTSDRDVTGINGKLIFEKLRRHMDTSDHKELEKAVDFWEENIAAGIVSLIHIFEPEKVLIGGGVSAAGECFMAPLSEKIYSHIMPRFRDLLVIEPAKLKNDAGLIGAVYYTIKSEGFCE